METQTTNATNFLSEEESLEIESQQVIQQSEQAYEDWLTDNQPEIAIALFKNGTNKVNIKKVAIEAVNNVLEQGNVLQVVEAISAMEVFVKEVKDDPRFKDYVREEASKTPKGFISNSGAKIECAEVGTTYDFSGCGDPLLEDLENTSKSSADNLKARKEFLKTVPSAGMDIVTSDGEVVKIYPPTKTSTSSFKVTLAK